MGPRFNFGAEPEALDLTSSLLRISSIFVARCGSGSGLGCRLGAVVFLGLIAFGPFIGVLNLNTWRCRLGAGAVEDPASGWNASGFSVETAALIFGVYGANLCFLAAGVFFAMTFAAFFFAGILAFSAARGVSIGSGTADSAAETRSCRPNASALDTTSFLTGSGVFSASCAAAANTSRFNIAVARSRLAASKVATILGFSNMRLSSSGCSFLTQARSELDTAWRWISSIQPRSVSMKILLRESYLSGRGPGLMYGYCSPLSRGMSPS